LILDLSVLLIYALMAINFHFRTAFSVSHRLLWIMFSFSLTSRKLLISSFIPSMTLCAVYLSTIWVFFAIVFVVEF
jgi:hypothetical protein